MNKTLLACLIAASFALPAQAKLGGSRSSSKPAYRPAPQQQVSPASQPQRLGSGNNVGMQRQQTMNQVRQQPQQAPAYTAPVQQAVPQQQRNGMGLGTVAGAAVAGAAVGYMVGNHNTPSAGTAAAPAAGSSAVAPTGAAAAPVAASTGSNTLMWVLLLAGLAGGAFWMMRRKQTSPVGPRPMAVKSGLNIPKIGGGASGFGGSNSLNPLQAEDLFRELQSANSSGNGSLLKQCCTPSLFAEISAGLGSSQTQVLAVRAQIVDENDGVCSVRFKGSIMENQSHPEEIDEVWHFVRGQAGERAWVLAGIEQV